MIGLDTTVLVAHELKEIHSREKVRAHISTLSRSKETRFALAPQVLQEFLHVVTDSRRFENPLSMEEALARARFWWTASETAHCHPSDKTWDLTLDWMERYHLGRKRILDTNLASTYHSHGIIKLATVNPADFAIFEVFEFETWAFTL
jgi:predicted nucleic acid-binding protein